VRAYTGTTHRQSNGKGTTGTEYDITVIADFPRDITFESQNLAVFAENIFRISDKFLVIPGVRYEWLKGEASGRNGYVAGVEQRLQDVERSRGFLLAGVGTEFHVTTGTEFYANYSQAYRPIQFANLQAPPTTDVVDPDLKDAQGYNVDLGYRGKVKDFLQFDVSGFLLQYNNRVGTVVVTNNATTPATTYRLITNVGASTSKGFEGYVEFNPVKAMSNQTYFDLMVFGSYGYTDAKYSSDHKDATTKGKKVENAPESIFRGGLSAGIKGFLLTGQVSYTSSMYSDANNTETVSANGTVGLIPSYTVTDLTASYKFTKNISVKAGINNLLDERYFTRRAGGYPGPGALPGDGRTYFLTVGGKF
jgi:Fe(3+) dicitrate transport protein